MLVRAGEALAAAGLESSLRALASGATSACKGTGEWWETAEAFFKGLFSFFGQMNQLNCFMCSGMFRERCLSQWNRGTVFFSSLTVPGRPSCRVVACGEQSWRQSVAWLVWMSARGSQLDGSGSSHHTPGLRVRSGLEKVRKSKPCLMVKLFMNFPVLSDVRGCWCSVVTSPPRERGVALSGWHNGQKNLCSYMSQDTWQTGLRRGFLM